MKVYSVAFNPLNFKSHTKFEDYTDEDELFNFTDDYDSDDKKVRDAIREHMYANFLTRDVFVNPKNAYADSIKDLNIPNLEEIGENSYRGATLAKHLHAVELLKRSGVSNVIDLVGYENLEIACNDNKIQYTKYPVDNFYWANPIFDNEKEARENFKKGLIEATFPEHINEDIPDECFEHEFKIRDIEISLGRRIFMDNFIDLVHKMQNGHFYISCEHGELRTPNILAMNTYFNPKWTGVKTKPTDENHYEKMKNMYLNMTENEKKRLGFTQEHEEKLKEEFDL